MCVGKSLIRRFVETIRASLHVFHQTGRDNRPFQREAHSFLSWFSPLNVLELQIVLTAILTMLWVAGFYLGLVELYGQAVVWVLCTILIMLALVYRSIIKFREGV